MAQASDHDQHRVDAQSGSIPQTGAITTSDFIVRKARDIQKQACDDIEVMFLMNLSELSKSRPAVRPHEYMELTPEHPIFPRGAVSQPSDVRTARPVGFFDNDDTSGGDGSRSVQNAPSANQLTSLLTAREYSPIPLRTGRSSSPYLQTARSRSASTARQPQSPALVPYDPALRTGRSPEPKTGRESSTRTGRSPRPKTGREPSFREPSTRTGRSPRPKTGREASTVTGRSPGPKTGREPSSRLLSTRTGRSPAPNTGREASTRTGRSPRPMTGREPSTLTGRSPGPKTGREPSTRTGTETSLRTGQGVTPRTGREPSFHEPSTRTARSPGLKTGREASTITGRSPGPQTGREPSIRTGRSPEPKTGREQSLRTGAEPSLRTGQGITPRTGREPSMRTGVESSLRTGRSPGPNTGREASTRTGRSPEPKTGREPSLRTGAEPSLRTGQGITPQTGREPSFHEPSTRTGRSPGPKTGREASTRTGRSPLPKTGREASTRTGRSPRPRTAREHSLRTGEERSLRTGRSITPLTARSPGPNTILRNSTVPQPSSEPACSSPLRTGRDSSLREPSTRTGRSPAPKTGLEALRTGRSRTPSVHEVPSLHTGVSPGSRTAQEPTSIRTGRSPFQKSGPTSIRTGREASPKESSVRTAVPHSTVTGRGPSSTRTAVSPGVRTGRSVTPLNTARSPLSKYLFGRSADGYPTMPKESPPRTAREMKSSREVKSQRSAPKTPKSDGRSPLRSRREQEPGKMFKSRLVGSVKTARTASPSEPKVSGRGSKVIEEGPSSEHTNSCICGIADEDDDDLLAPRRTHDHLLPGSKKSEYAIGEKPSFSAVPSDGLHTARLNKRKPQCRPGDHLLKCPRFRKVPKLKPISRPTSPKPSFLAMGERPSEYALQPQPAPSEYAIGEKPSFYALTPLRTARELSPSMNTARQAEQSPLQTGAEYSDYVVSPKKSELAMGQRPSITALSRSPRTARSELGEPSTRTGLTRSESCLEPKSSRYAIGEKWSQSCLTDYRTGRSPSPPSTATAFDPTITEYNTAEPVTTPLNSDRLLLGSPIPPTRPTVTARQPSTTRSGRSPNVFTGRSPSTRTGRDMSRRSDDQSLRSGRPLTPVPSVHTGRAPPSSSRTGRSPSSKTGRLWSDRPTSDVNTALSPTPSQLRVQRHARTPRADSVKTGRHKSSNSRTAIERSPDMRTARPLQARVGPPFSIRTGRSASPITGRHISSGSRTGIKRSPDVRTALPVGPVCEECLRSPMSTARALPSEVRTAMENPEYRTATLKETERSDGLRTGKYGSVESPEIRRVVSQPKVEEFDSECPMCHRAFVVQKEVQEEHTISRRSRVRLDGIDPNAPIARRFQRSSSMATARGKSSRDSSTSSFTSGTSIYSSGASSGNASSLSTGSELLENDEDTVTVNVLVVSPTSRGHVFRRMTKAFTGDITLKKAIKVLAKEISPKHRLRLNQIYFEHGDVTTERGRLQHVGLDVIGNEILSACTGRQGIRLVLDFAGAFDKL